MRESEREREIEVEKKMQIWGEKHKERLIEMENRIRHQRIEAEYKKEN